MKATHNFQAGVNTFWAYFWQLSHFTKVKCVFSHTLSVVILRLSSRNSNRAVVKKKNKVKQQYYHFGFVLYLVHSTNRERKRKRESERGRKKNSNLKWHEKPHFKQYRKYCSSDDWETESTRKKGSSSENPCVHIRYMHTLISW